MWRRTASVAAAALLLLAVGGVAWSAIRRPEPAASASVRTTTTTAPAAVTTATSTSTSSPSSTTTSSTSTSTTTEAPPTTTTTLDPPPEFPNITPSEYGLLLEALAPYPGTAWPVEPPAITGDAAADARLRLVAEFRGYRHRPDAVVSMVAVDGVVVHPDAAEALRALLAEARSHGLEIGVRSGHRSVSRQRQIFERELAGEAHRRIERSYSVEEIAAGEADAAINAVLGWHSIPGYSRHHSGLAVDFEAGPGPLGAFAGTPTEEWLRADDFANAKRFGFVPGYPAGAEPQGPRPEPWEYVYVGTGNIRCAALHVALADPDAVRSCPLVGS